MLPVVRSRRIIGAELLRFGSLGGRRRERGDVTAERASILKCDVPQSADADDTEAGVPRYGVTQQWSEYGNAAAQERRRISDAKPSGIGNAKRESTRMCVA